MVAFRKKSCFLSPPLFGIIYIGLYPTFVDVILMWSKLAQPRACLYCPMLLRNDTDNWRRNQNLNVMTSLREHCAIIARALREHCASIARALREHCASIARALREHWASIARALREHCASIARAFREHCATSSKE